MPTATPMSARTRRVSRLVADGTVGITSGDETVALDEIDIRALLGRVADGVVVGSAIVDRIEAAGSRESAVEDVAAFIETLKAPLRP